MGEAIQLAANQNIFILTFSNQPKFWVESSKCGGAFDTRMLS